MQIDFTNLPATVKTLLETTSLSLTKLVESHVGNEGDFSKIECAALQISNELTRRFLEQRLQKMADQTGDILKITQNCIQSDLSKYFDYRYKRHQRGKVTYHSLVGGLKICRWTYRRMSARNGATVVPLELEAGLVERCTPALAKALLLGYAKVPMREWRENLEIAYCCPPSRTTMENIAKKAGSKANSGIFFIENAIRDKEIVPEGAKTIAIGLDRTSVPMEEASEKKNSPVRPRKKPRVRKTPAPIEVNWRMDYVATVCFVDETGEPLVTRRYRLAFNQDPVFIVDRVCADVKHGLKQYPFLQVAIIQDGAPELWSALRKGLKNVTEIKHWYEVLDWFHMSERLCASLGLLEKCDEKRSKLISNWHQKLSESDDGASQLIVWLKERLPTLQNNANDELNKNINYFEKRIHLINYSQAKLHGIPLGSGITEGTCKSLVGKRAKRGGQRWRKTGLGVVLGLRELYLGNRFEPFWQEFQEEYKAYEIKAA